MLRQVYGCQPTWKKWVKRLAGRGTEEKFDEVVQQLTQLTQQIWALQEGSNQGAMTSRCEAYPGAGSVLWGTLWGVLPLWRSHLQSHATEATNGHCQSLSPHRQSRHHLMEFSRHSAALVHALCCQCIQVWGWRTSPRAGMHRCGRCRVRRKVPTC